MPFGTTFGYGLQRVIDANLQFTRTGHSVALRIRNFPDVQDKPWAQLGFAISPTGTDDIGTQDIPIVPQPAIDQVSQWLIGQSMGKLRAGARTFIISATFVDNLVANGMFNTPNQVWTDPIVVGLVCDDQLFDIVQYYDREVAGKSIQWELQANAVENR